jgi:hypothetical protein
VPEFRLAVAMRSSATTTYQTAGTRRETDDRLVCSSRAFVRRMARRSARPGKLPKESCHCSNCGFGTSLVGSFIPFAYAPYNLCGVSIEFRQTKIPTYLLKKRLVLVVGIVGWPALAQTVFGYRAYRLRPEDLSAFYELIRREKLKFYKG